MEMSGLQTKLKILWRNATNFSTNEYRIPVIFIGKHIKKTAQFSLFSHTKFKMESQFQQTWEESIYNNDA